MGIDKKEIVEGPPIVEADNSPAFVFLRRDRALTVGTGKSASLSFPFAIGGAGDIEVGDGDGPGGDDPEVPIDPTDVPSLTDVEEITYEQYYDGYSSVRYNAILKVRNSSKKRDEVIAVDARNTPKSGTAATGSTGQNQNFITPAPTVPSVAFDRTGTAIAWGWNNSTNLGSYESISYEWEIRSTSSSSGSIISSGTKEYAASGSFAIGNSGKSKRYRVSSGDGDTPATASARWLRVRAVVVGTNGKTYYSRYSNPI